MQADAQHPSLSRRHTSTIAVNTPAMDYARDLPLHLFVDGETAAASSRGASESVLDSTASDTVSKGMREAHGVLYTALWCHRGMTETMRERSKRKALF